MHSLVLLMPYLIFIFVPLVTIAFIWVGVAIIKSNKRQEESLQNIEKHLHEIIQYENGKQ